MSPWLEKPNGKLSSSNKSWRWTKHLLIKLKTTLCRILQTSPTLYIIILVIAIAVITNDVFNKIFILVNFIPNLKVRRRRSIWRRQTSVWSVVALIIILWNDVGSLSADPSWPDPVSGFSEMWSDRSCWLVPRISGLVFDLVAGCRAREVEKFGRWKWNLVVS